MDRKRVGSTGVFGVALLLLVAVEPAAAQWLSDSTTESLIWNLNNKLLYVAVPITILVEGILIYTVWKFARSGEAKPTQENRRLEITWTVATAVILLFVGVASYQVLGNPYVTASPGPDIEQPEQRTEIQVFAFAYGWQFQYTVDAEEVSGENLTLENATVSEATVVNSTETGVVVENARLSTPEVENATLESATLEGVDGQPGEQISAENVTAADATIQGATLSDATVQSSNTMLMPVDRDVQLNITSRDLLHAFHVPGLGLKKDAFPDHYTYLQTRATETGEYQLYCAEYCGVGHSDMLGTVEVVPQDEYEQWLIDQWKQDKQ